MIDKCNYCPTIIVFSGVLIFLLISIIVLDTDF